MGNNSSGFKNEKNMRNALNNKQYSKLNSNLKQFVKFMYPSCSEKADIVCVVKNDQGKPDIKLEIETCAFNVSVKEGSENSVHQEKVEDFIAYAKSELKMSESQANNLMKFIYGDGTVDGTADRKDRKKATVVAKEMKKELDDIQEFFDKNKDELVKRFVIEGTTGSEKVDYLYYGTPDRGMVCNVDEIYEIHRNQRNNMKAALRIGNLSLQAWKRALPTTIRTEEGWKKADKDRGQIQVKWSSLEEDMNLLRMCDSTTARIGELYEYSFSQFLNKNKNSKEWTFLKENIGIEMTEDVYAVKVHGQKTSKAIGGMVNAKTDVYLVKMNITPEKLHELNYDLNENNIKEFSPEIINGSGISVKIKDSSNFTYCKMSPKAFEYICGKENKYLGVGCSFFVQKEKDMKKNIRALQVWGISLDELIKRFSNIENIERLAKRIKNKEKVKIYKDIKEYSKQKLSELIDSDIKIKEKIFKGKDIFDEPYFANYIFAGGRLEKITQDEKFVITTASGRTAKERYDLAIKPKK